MLKLGKYRYFRNTPEIDEFSDCFVNGYLLEEIPAIDPSHKVGYKPILLSLIGHKNRLVGSSKTPRHLRLSFEDSGLMGYVEGGLFSLEKPDGREKPDLRDRWFVCRRMDQEKEEFSQPVRSQDSTVYTQNFVFRDKMCNPEHVGLENEGDCFIVGRDKAELMQRVPVYLSRITAPYPPEWTEAIWQRICLMPTEKLHIKELIGYNVAGIKFTYDAEVLRQLISEMYLNGEFDEVAAA